MSIECLHSCHVMGDFPVRRGAFAGMSATLAIDVGRDQLAQGGLLSPTLSIKWDAICPLKAGAEISSLFKGHFLYSLS